MDNIINEGNINHLIKDGYTNQQIIKRINQQINENLCGWKYDTIPYKGMTLKLFLYSNSINENTNDNDFQYIKQIIDKSNQLDEKQSNMEWIMDRMKRYGMTSLDEWYNHMDETKKDIMSDLQTRISSLMVKSKGNQTKYSFYTGLSTLLLSGMVTKDEKKRNKIVNIVKSLLGRMK